MSSKNTKIKVNNTLEDCQQKPAWSKATHNIRSNNISAIDVESEYSAVLMIVSLYLNCCIYFPPGKHLNLNVFCQFILAQFFHYYKPTWNTKIKVNNTLEDCQQKPAWSKATHNIRSNNISAIDVESEYSAVLMIVSLYLNCCIYFPPGKHLNLNVFCQFILAQFFHYYKPIWPLLIFED